MDRVQGQHWSPWNQGIHFPFFIYTLCIYLFGCTRSWSQHVGALIFTVACQIFSYSMQDLVPRPGINPWTPCIEDMEF